METTVYLIKPEGMCNKRVIRGIIKKSGLAIIRKKMLLLPEWAIDLLYPELSPELRIATITMLTAPVEMGLVCGNEAVRRLFVLSGTAVAPAQCEPESIRFRFGEKEAILFGPSAYYANAIHRPRNKAEAERDVALFHRLS